MLQEVFSLFTLYQKILFILILGLLCTVPVIIALTDEPSQTVQPLSAQTTGLSSKTWTSKSPPEPAPKPSASAGPLML